MTTTIQQLTDKVGALTDDQLADVLRANETIEANLKGRDDETLVLVRAEALRRWGTMFPPRRAPDTTAGDILFVHPKAAQAQQDKAVLKMVIGAILAWDISSVVLSTLMFQRLLHLPSEAFADALGNIIGTAVGPILALSWDAVPCFFLWKGKSWARIFLLVTRWLMLPVTAIIAVYASDYVSLPLAIGIVASQMILLRKHLSKKAAQVWFAVFLGLVVSISLRHLPQWRMLLGEQKLIEQGQPMQTYKSPLHYKFAYPVSGWKAMDKAMAADIIRKDLDAADIFVGKNDGSAYGFFVAEGIDSRAASQESLAKVSDWLQQNYFKDAKDVASHPFAGGAGLTGKRFVGGQHFSYVGFFKPLEKVGITAYFWAQEKYEAGLRKDVETFYNTLEELPRREWQGPRTAKEIYDRFSNAVVLITVYNNKKQVLGYGSGFNISPDGLVVTSLHVIAGGAAYADVTFPKNGMYKDVRVFGASEANADLAFLKLDGAKLPVVLQSSSSDVAVGDKVYVISNPKGLLNTLTEGIVSGNRIIDGGVHAYQITAPMSPGSSGGAVLNEYGEVIGIAFVILQDSQNLNFCIAADEIAGVRAFEQSVPLKDLRNYLNLRRAGAGGK